MRCINCGCADFATAERCNVEIEVCRNCHGVWLDRGELDLIIARAIEEHDARRAWLERSKQAKGLAR